MTTGSDSKRDIGVALAPYLPVLYLLIYGITGGATFSLAKLAAAEGVHPAGYTFWQCAGAAVVLLLVCVLRGDPPRLQRRLLGFFAVTGVLCLAIPNVTMYLAVTHIPAGVMAIIIATMPLMTYGLSLPFNIERFQMLRFAGVCIGLAGALLILIPSAHLSEPTSLAWIGLAFLVPLLFSAGNLYVSRHRPPAMNALTLTAGMLSMATLALGVFVIESGTFYTPDPTPGLAEGVIVLQIVASSIGYLLFFEIIRLAGPVFFSQIGYVITISGTGWGAVLHSENLGLAIWAAAGLILFGVALVSGHARLKAATA